MAARVVEQVSEVPAPVDAVWHRVVTPEGINDEMRPWMTMTMPKGTENLTIDTLQLGVPLGRAWLRLFGVVPFDYDALSIVAVEPGRSFHEKSTMLSARTWEHERTLTPLESGGTRVHDRLTFVPRLPLSGALHALVIRLFFAHRHRRLARYFA